MKSLCLAIQFLSKIPLVAHYQSVSDQDMARSVIWYPFIGIGYGLALFGIAKIIPDSMPALACAILMVAFEFLISGGLHYDGLSDLADGWFSGREIPRQLEIMKDSRSGVMGVASLLLILLFKIVMFAEFKYSWHVLVAYGLVGKQILVLAVYLFPYARKQGTGGLLQKVKLWHVLLSLIWVSILWVVRPVQFTLLMNLIGSIAISLIIAWVISNRYSGLTGDCYGALHEISQIIFLILMGVFI